MTKIERVPVRIQFWTKGQMKVEVRGWLDNFKIETDAEALAQRFDGSTTYLPAVRRDITLAAHTDKAWKFHRGKPKVDE